MMVGICRWKQTRAQSAGGWLLSTVPQGRCRTEARWGSFLWSSWTALAKTDYGLWITVALLWFVCCLGNTKLLTIGKGKLAVRRYTVCIQDHKNWVSIAVQWSVCMIVHQYQSMPMQMQCTMYPPDLHMYLFPIKHCHISGVFFKNKSFQVYL